MADDLIESLPENLSKSQITDFHTASAKVRNYPQEEKTNTLLNRAFTQAQEIFDGSAILKCGRGKINSATLSKACCSALENILKAITWHHLHRCLQNTQGVFRILKAYHKNYDRLVRRPGRLAFADLTHLLAPDCTGSPMGATDEDARQLMDYRLDAKYDHWLFDEFQDTSRPQWEVVANLIDEIVQDNSGQRSLFYVGDTKQCLYLWRNSDDRLFHDILRLYPNITVNPLATSWRSAPAILDAVNMVFDDHALIEEVFGQDAAERWSRAWMQHHASEKTQSWNGYACWLQAHKDESPTRNQRILDTLLNLNPVDQGLSVGVLVRTNSDANEIADYLRENCDFPIHTGSAIKPAEDNAAGATLLSMLRLAAHPGDTHAKGFLRLIDASTPGDSLIHTISELRSRLLTDSHESAVRWACSQIIRHLPDCDRRHRLRMEQLIEQARAFDNEEYRDIDALYNFLKSSRSGECTPGDAVIVETIHKSKGLEYDIVILVCEDKSVRSERRISALLDPNGKAEWVLEPLKKELMLADPALSRLYQQSESQQGFASLCTLYVGMTRAKRALYMISDFERVSQNSTVHFLRERLGGEANEEGILWQTGSPDWHQDINKSPKHSNINESPSTSVNFGPAHQRLQLARPSLGKAIQLNAGRFFDLGENASDFGTAVHDAFEQIEWLNENESYTLPPIDSKLTSERPDSPESQMRETVVQALQRCFENDEIRKLFTRPQAPTTVWREKAFSLVEGDELINGVFDRVHLHINSAGDVTSAEIIDFKTDRIHDGNPIDQIAKHHRPQLETYRRALCKILSLSESHIQLSLVLTNQPALLRL